MQRVPPEARCINDIAISGNGEPTSAQEFAEVIDIIARLKPVDLKLVLITNGSLMQRENVQQGLRRMALLNGEVWFKLDRASEAGMQLVNDTRMTMDKVQQNLAAAIACCPNTWLQTAGLRWITRRRVRRTKTTMWISSKACCVAASLHKECCCMVWRDLPCRRKDRAYPRYRMNRWKASRHASACWGWM
jgi:hypothetical protein